MIQAKPRPDRREHARFPLGLPVVIHVEERSESLTVEVVEIAARSVRFRSMGPTPAVDERVNFGFVTAGSESCFANGRVMRVDGGDEFVVVIERANPAFDDFVGSLSSAA